MSQNKIPILDLKSQYSSIKAEISQAIAGVLDSGQFILGEDVKLFEQEVADYLGVKHAIGVNSGTDALIIGLRAMGIGPGDEVITTPFSFFATAESISNVGAKPIFADILADNFNINPKAIKEKITPHTKAIMPVHLFGCPAAMAQIMDIASSHNLMVIEDCAQSFGSRYYSNCSTCNNDCVAETRESLKGKFTGNIGNIGAFSFFPTKNLGAYGDGGLITTNDDNLAEWARMLRVHGSKAKYKNEVLGYNSRLDSLQAAILRVKLKYIDKWNQQRRKVATTYNQLLSNIPEIITPEVADGHVFHQYTIRITNGKRDQVQEYLKSQGISTMIYYPVPQDKLPVYQGQYPPLPVSDLIATEVLSLPIWPEIDTATLTQIVNNLKVSLSSNIK